MVEEALGPPDPTRLIEGREYRVLRLDRDRLARLLARAPLEQAGQVISSTVVLELPWPDATFKPFRVEEASIIEPGLKVRCPDVKTYRGRGVTDTSASAHFEWSPSGFRAVLSASKGQVYIAPYSARNTQNYIVYNARDWRPAPEKPAAYGRVAPDPPPTMPASARPPSSAAIEEITIQRGCFGCENHYKLTLKRDGTATLMRMGVLAFGRLDQRCTGTVGREAFGKLAAVVQGSGFFDLDDVYQDPRLADGGAVITTAVVAGRRKTVVDSNRKGPPNLLAIEDAVEGLGETVPWKAGRP